MAEKFELEDDIDIKLGEPAYYPISGNEVSDIPAMSVDNPTAMPYSSVTFRTKVKLNWHGNTVLKYEFGGKAKWAIFGQLTRPNGFESEEFRITTANKMDSKDVRIPCRVIIKKSKAAHLKEWNLDIWYEGKSDNKLRSKRIVIDDGWVPNWLRRVTGL